MMFSIVALGAWGWLNQNLVAAALMIALILTVFVMPWRWRLTEQQFYRVGDFISVLLALTLLYFVFSDTAVRPVYFILEWLPAFFAPILLAQFASGQTAIPIGTVFYSQRKREIIERMDFSIVFSCFCLLAAGAVNDGSWLYFSVCVFLVGELLWKHRSKNAPVILWFVVMATAIGISLLGQRGLLAAQGRVEQAVINWLSDFHYDPFKTRTSIGDIGELKMSDRIEFKVKAEHPGLLMHSVYDRTTGKVWVASKRSFANYEPDMEIGPQWMSAEYFQLVRRQAILSLPPGVQAIKGLEGIDVSINGFGTVKLNNVPDFINYTVAYDGKRIGDYSDYDLSIPERHQSWIKVIKAQLDLDHEEPDVIAKRLVGFFRSQYYYTLFSETEMDADQALEHFIMQRKAGHCEYFAVASVLLLRSYGIPARLANGFAMREFDPDSGLFLIRRRHAHAWAIARINDQWIDVDATPAQWLDMEEEQSDVWQPVSDWFSSIYYAFKQWRLEQAREEQEQEQTGFWLGVAVVLLLILLWNIFRLRKQIEDKKKSTQSLQGVVYPGMDSALFDIEQRLAKTERARLPNEAMLNWAKRLNDAELIKLVQLHNRYRFDDQITGEPLRDAIEKAAKKWRKT